MPGSEWPGAIEVGDYYEIGTGGGVIPLTAASGGRLFYAPAEVRTLTLPDEERTLLVPAEVRTFVIPES